jgi:parallel beta-helix repeat protein
VLACVLSSSWATRAAAATVYYVDANSVSCSGSGPGTEAQPYCTITSAMNAHNGAGVTIVVKPGVYREQVTVPNSGAAGNPFVLKALTPDVILDGSDSFGDPAQWTAVAPSKTWRAPAVTWPPKQVIVDGARLDSVATSPDSLPGNSFVWISGEGLYVNLDGTNPGQHDTRVGHRSYGFSIFAKSWVTVDGFTILRPEDRGVYLQNACTNILVCNNRESLSGGIGMQGVGGSNLTFQNNVVFDNIGHGIALISGATGCWIRGNESYGNADPKSRVSNGIYLFGSPANTLCSNRCHDNQDTGMHLQTGSNDCVAFNNVSYNNGDHGYDHLFAIGTTHVGDVAYGNYMDGFSIEGSASGVRLSNCISVNNGLTTNRFDLWIDGNSVSGFQSDYNIFWNSTSQAPFKYIASIYTTLSGYQSASGQDPHTMQTDPGFLDGAGGNFHLLPESPAIDSGDSQSPDWPATDADGQPRMDIPSVPNTGAGNISYADRGAFERISTAVDVPVETFHGADLRLVPNPMHTRGTLRLALERPGHLRIQMLDPQGRIVRHVADRQAPAGRLEIEIPGSDDSGRPLQSGVYFVRVETLGRILQGRCLILR